MLGIMIWHSFLTLMAAESNWLLHFPFTVMVYSIASAGGSAIGSKQFTQLNPAAGVQVKEDTLETLAFSCTVLLQVNISSSTETLGILLLTKTNTAVDAVQVPYRPVTK